MSYKNIKIWRRKTKQRMVNAFGGKCGICDYNKCNAALEFHHLNPDEKEFGFGSIRSWEKAVIEVRKCVLLCSNCHVEVHNGITQIPENITRFDESFAEYREQFKKNMMDNCPICGGDKRIDYLTCSNSCGGKRREVIDWDSIDLLKMYKEIGTYIGVAEKLNVSDSTIRKHILKLNKVGSSNGKKHG